MLDAISLSKNYVEIYQANTLTEGCRKCTQYSYGGIEPLSPSIAPRLNELLNIVLSVEYVEDSARRIAILQLGCELMRKNVLLRLLLMVVQGSVENRLGIRGRA
jgi:hypothetical protein